MVPHTNKKFKPYLLSTLAGICYTLHKHLQAQTIIFKSTLTFLDLAKQWKSISAARQNPEILAISL